jgi:hypothetical protein
VARVIQPAIIVRSSAYPRGTSSRGADWTILQASGEYEKTDSKMVEFRFRLEPGQEKKIRYTAQYTF